MGLGMGYLLPNYSENKQGIGLQFIGMVYNIVISSNTDTNLIPRRYTI